VLPELRQLHKHYHKAAMEDASIVYNSEELHIDDVLGILENSF